MGAATHSALLVAVPAAEALISEHRARLDPSALRGVPPHVTVLYPFMAPDEIDDDVVECLARGFAACPRFQFELADVRWFGDTVAYLAPEPAGPFRDLTRNAVELFPAFPPYQGAYADLTPHVTIGQDAPIDVLRAAVDAVATALPIHTSATALTLMVGGTEPASWRVHTQFPFGSERPRAGYPGEQRATHD
ncbi:MAG: 2'-5' RNA ligase family protein [Acidimicrobiia bacterium]